jgi:hypothetical protein
MRCKTSAAVGAAVSGPASCSMREPHGASAAGRTRARHPLRSALVSRPPIARTSAAMLAAISPA